MDVKFCFCGINRESEEAGGCVELRRWVLKEGDKRIGRLVGSFWVFIYVGYTFFIIL